MSDPFYSSAAWRAFRAEVLSERPFCEVPGCGRASTDVDHTDAIRRGGERIDKRNVKAHCHSHHSSKTVQVDGGFGRPRKPASAVIYKGVGPDGAPIDPNHPWHRDRR